jgi:putative methionine-R-sulfoxide reductase with GAF domain
VSEQKNKPVRDEQTLAKVLEAAYVLQERNRELKNKAPVSEPTRNPLVAEQGSGSGPGAAQTPFVSPISKGDPARSSSTSVLAQIVEIQHQIQVRHLGLEKAMSLVAERLTQIAGVGGAGVAIRDGEKVHYKAGAGPMALTAGTDVPLENALCVECLRSGHIFRCADVDSGSLPDRNERRRRGIQSMVAVPVFHDGGVAGSLELYFSSPGAFTEDDVHTCQLMAGLVTEALARNEEVSWKKSLASERAVMLEALEKLKPNLAALADTPAARDSAPIPAASAMAWSGSTFVCRKCGHELVGQEQFCGNCGSPRSTEEPADSDSAMASLWQLQEAMKNASLVHLPNVVAVPEESQKNLDSASVESAPGSMMEQFSARLSIEPFAVPEPERERKTESKALPEALVRADFENAGPSDLEIPPQTGQEDDVETPEPTAPAKPEPAPAWSSAATTLAFLQQLAAVKDPGAWAEIWNRRRGDIYLAIAVVLVIGVVRWGMWFNYSASATGNPAASTAHHKAAPDADLPLFDRILVKLGLAEAPEPPEYKGNPRTQVWVDLHTALYYCPGADLYGKTAKGRFSTQRDAQLDQFEPAYRKACD